MKSFCWFLSLLGAVIGLFVLFVGLNGANGAPQEAATAGMALAFAVIPYCIARAVSELFGGSEVKKEVQIVPNQEVNLNS
jgi:hypothetical protein